jgi:hypothetical protein
LIRQDFPDGFTLDEMKKQYGILANQAKKWIKMMIELQLVKKLSDSEYVTSSKLE